MNSLDAARAAAAIPYEGEVTSFKDGWDACLAHLEKAAGSFDEQVTRREIVRKYDSCSQHDVDIARWQHSQDAARIGLAERRLEQCNMELDQTDKVYRMNREFVEEAKDKIKALEAKLAECEALYRIECKMRVQDEKERQR